MKFFKRKNEEKLVERLIEAEAEKRRVKAKEGQVEYTTLKLQKALEGNKFGERIYRMLVEAQR